MLLTHYRITNLKREIEMDLPALRLLLRKRRNLVGGGCSCTVNPCLACAHLRPSDRSSHLSHPRVEVPVVHPRARSRPLPNRPVIHISTVVPSRVILLHRSCPSIWMLRSPCGDLAPPLFLPNFLVPSPLLVMSSPLDPSSPLVSCNSSALPSPLTP